MVGVKSELVRSWSGEYLNYLFVDGSLPEVFIEFEQSEYDSKNYLREINAEIPVFAEHNDVKGFVVVPSLVVSGDKAIRQEAFRALKKVIGVANSNEKMRDIMKKKLWRLSGKSKWRVVSKEVKSIKDLQKFLAMVLIHEQLIRVFPGAELEVQWPISRPDLIVFGTGPNTANSITALARALANGKAKFFAFDLQRRRILHLRTLEQVNKALDKGFQVLVVSRVYYRDYRDMQKTKTYWAWAEVGVSLVKTVKGILERGYEYVWIAPMVEGRIKKFTTHVEGLVLQWGSHELLVGKRVIGSKTNSALEGQFIEVNYDVSPVIRVFDVLGIDFWAEVERVLSRRLFRGALENGSEEEFEFVKAGQKYWTLVARTGKVEGGLQLALGFKEGSSQPKWFFVGRVVFTHLKQVAPQKGGGHTWQVSIEVVGKDRVLKIQETVKEELLRRWEVAFPEIKKVRVLSGA